MLTRLADLVSRRPRRLLVAVAAAFAVAVVFGGPVAGILGSDDDFSDPGGESTLASERLERLAGMEQSPDAIVLVRGGGRERLAAVAAQAREVPGVARVVRGATSKDGDATWLALFTRAGTGDKLVADLQRLERPGVLVGGGEVANEAIGEQVSEDLARAELLAFPILFLLSLWVFRGVVAALLPLFVGVLSIFGTFLALRIANAVDPLSIFALNLAIAMGLGLAIDYSLFVVSRYREELERHGHTAEAMRRTLATAGRTVVFSAVTVAVALLALTVFPMRFLSSMGLSGAFAALIAGAVAITALPALLVVLGPRVNALALGRWRTAAHLDASGAQQGFWYRLSRWVMRRPGPVALVTALVLLAAGIPALRIEFTGVDASILPKDSAPRQVDDALRTEFPPAPTSPLVVTLDTRDAAEARAYAAGLRERPDVAEVRPPRPVGGEVQVIDVVPRGTVLASKTLDLVDAIRAGPAPASVTVAGETAQFVDQQKALVAGLPLALAIIALTTFAILFLLTGSVVLPLKALVMNLLSLSAAFGLLVLIFQDGRLEGVLGYTSQGALEATQPVLLFAVAFALSTDYGVFLLTRIKEARDAGASDDEAVAVGLQRTGRIVTAAALLLSVALGAFATSQIIFIKQVGLGTVFAVLIDATVIRALLVPALMKLLGPWNWWAPRPLRRFHARFGLSEA